LPEAHVFEHLPKVFHALPTFLEPSLTHTWYVDAAHQPPIAGDFPDGTLFALMGVALLVGIVGIVGAYGLYGRGPSKTVDQLVDGPLHGPWEASKHKLWFDEVYDAIIIRPFKLLAKGLFEIVDRFIIDTVAVNGVAFVIGLFGRLARWFQNGQVQRYLAGLIVGAAAVFLVTDCHRHPTFDITRTGDTITLHAETGAGVVGNNVKLHWHLDGSTDCTGEKDRPADPPDLTVRAGDTGARVALCIDDPIERKMLVVSRAVPDVAEVTP
jgi:hypothetical protein